MILLINILYSKVELYINRLININHKCTESENCVKCEIVVTHNFVSAMNCFI